MAISDIKPGERVKTPEQRAHWQICGGGHGIHWPDIDEDLSTEGLLRGAPAPRSAMPVIV
jgi:hypothetical protein